MKPHEQRVVAELAREREDLAKLDAFVASPAIDELDAADRGLLLEQRHYMSNKVLVLSARVARFERASPAPAVPEPGDH